MLDLIIALLMATLPPCPTEDSQWCTWDARTQGNGPARGASLHAGSSTDGTSDAERGSSFVSLSEDFRIEY